MKNNEIWVEFAPTVVDVVSTKLRTWNLNHPGNLFYTDLVNSSAVSLDKDDLVKIKQRAEQIVHCIMVERGGRFLKPPDGDLHPTQCVVMDSKQAITKVVHALRTAHSRLGVQTTGGDVIIPTTTNKKSSRPPKPKSSPVEKSSTPTPRPRSRRSTMSSSSSDSLVYQATAQTKKIPQHLLNLITAVCNQFEAQTAHRVLDMPLKGQSLVDESDKDRRMRLHLRHRFASAAAMGMSPLEFAVCLLKLWEGTLITTKRRPKPKPKAQQLPQQAESNQAISTPVPSAVSSNANDHGAPTASLQLSSSANPAVPTLTSPPITHSVEPTTANLATMTTEFLPIATTDNSLQETTVASNVHDMPQLGNESYPDDFLQGGPCG